MRLGFVTPRSEVRGDAASRASDLGRRLVARGHSVEVFPVLSPAPGTFPLHRSDLDALVFFSCPARPEQHGFSLPPHRVVVVVTGSQCPTLPEPGATLVFDTPEEQARLAPDAHLRGEVIGPGVELGPEACDDEAPLALKGLGHYLLLCGPLEAKDGYAVTVDAFLRAEREGGAPVTLVLVGRGRISLGENVHVRQLGDLSEAARDHAIRGALAVLVPARREALAPSALLAWRLGRPVVAHGRSEVMRGLVVRANGGIACETGEELAAALELLAADPGLGAALGRQGRDYLKAHYSWPVVLKKWERLLASVATGGAEAA